MSKKTEAALNLVRLIAAQIVIEHLKTVAPVNDPDNNGRKLNNPGTDDKKAA